MIRRVKCRCHGKAVPPCARFAHGEKACSLQAHQESLALQECSIANQGRFECRMPPLTPVRSMHWIEHGAQYELCFPCDEDGCGPSSADGSIDAERCTERFRQNRSGQQKSAMAAIGSRALRRPIVGTPASIGAMSFLRRRSQAGSSSSKSWCCHVASCIGILLFCRIYQFASVCGPAAPVWRWLGEHRRRDDDVHRTGRASTGADGSKGVATSRRAD